MNDEIEECKRLAWKIKPLSRRRVLARLEMTKNGAEPGRSRTRNSHLKALQYELEGLSSFVNWAQMWMMGLANKDEDTTVGACQNCSAGEREVDNPDGSKRTKLRPIALLETLLKLIESVAVDQHADHMMVLMQEQQVGFRVRKFMKNDANRVLMQGDISNACGSINRWLC